MRIPYEPPDETFPINVTNMIDVFLLLLIFFLVATTFVREERDSSVKLPVAKADSALTATVSEVVLNIRQDGTITVSGKPVTREELPGILAREAAATDKARFVTIRTDAEAQMKHFANLVVTCKRAGFSDVRVGYIPEGSE